MAFDMKQFVKDREEALLSLDEAKIRAYAAKYGETLPIGESFWFGVHKAITALPSLPKDFRLKSKAWLLLRGSKSMDDGDLNL